MAALVVLLIQIPQWRTLLNNPDSNAPGPSFLTVMILLPAVAFGIAYGVARLSTRNRAKGAKGPSRTRLGLLLCFGVGPIGLLVSFLLSAT